MFATYIWKWHFLESKIIKTEPVHQAPVYQQIATMDHIETVQEDQAVEAFDGYAGYEDDGYQYQEDGGHYTDGQVALDTSRGGWSILWRLLFERMAFKMQFVKSSLLFSQSLKDTIKKCLIK